ncbi:RAQPRD family integrative conjugative element protein [Citrobacter sp. S2-9]|uniref:RAQPRD family integrative conjugative element protein n=1 Tax=Citrobacter enshiensis TaxID=2971264 RepID=A0ABT8PVB7_9ENTR|nr:RAQPRD family integrative conjugative element protein [Citrobacter enshiensis]MDN8600301.1 RAQPRD family integrative conjugative element protein [Citrobacter enshiensis]
MKIHPWLYLSCLLLATTVQAAPTSEEANLSLLLTQLNILESTLKRAEAQATVAPDTRFFFDYPQIYSDIHAMREGINTYLTPSRAQPRTVETFPARYRTEVAPQ